MKRRLQGASAANARSAPRRRDRGRSRSACPRRRARAAIAAGVAAGAEGAVDRGLPGLGGQERGQLLGEDGIVLDRASKFRSGVAARGRLGFGWAWSLHAHSASVRRPGPRRSRRRRRRAPPPASPRRRRSRSRGTRRRRSRRRGRRARRARSAASGRGCARPSRASRRRSRRGSGGAGCGRRLPKGLCGARKRSESCSNSLVVMHPDAGVEALGENDAVSEGGAEPRRNREAVLGVEAVLVETPKSHPRWVPFCEPGKELGPE